jgi:hypothetical protein
MSRSAQLASSHWLRRTDRSGAIQQAVEEKLARLDHSRLACECAKLAPKAEQAQADEGLERDLAEWPKY